LAGYAVECALKACIAKLTQQHDFPPERKFIEDCYSHEIDKLLRASGLTAQRYGQPTVWQELAVSKGLEREGALP